MLKNIYYKLIITICVFIALSIFNSCGSNDQYAQEFKRAPYSLQKINEWKINKPEVLPTPYYFSSLKDGSLIVIDVSLMTINHFDKEGNLIQIIGGKGRGPREFTQMTSVAINKKGYVAIADQGIARLSIFSIFDDQYLIENFELGWNTQLHWSNDSLIILNSPFRINGTNPGDITMRLYNFNSRSKDEFLHFNIDSLNNQSEQKSCTFCKFRFAKNLTFYTSPQDTSYQIYKFNPQTGEERLFSRKGLPSLEYSESEREKIVEVREWVMQRSGVELGDFMPPTHRNRFMDFFPDENGRLWVIPNVKPGNSLYFDIFSEDAEYLGSTEIPDNAEIINYVGDGEVIIKYLNKDLNIWEAGLYRVVNNADSS
jgi:hypothetical protein